VPEVTPTAIFRLLRRRSRSSCSANEPHVWTSAILRTGKLSFVSVPDDAASQRRVQASQRVLLVDDRLEDAAIGVIALCLKVLPAGSGAPASRVSRVCSAEFSCTMWPVSAAY